MSYLLHTPVLPENRLTELMSDLFAVRIPTATNAATGRRTARRTARRFEGFLDHVAELIRTVAPVKHFDEAGLCISTRTRCLHVPCTPFPTVLRIGTGRGDVGEDLEGVLIHDNCATHVTLGACRIYSWGAGMAMAQLCRSRRPGQAPSSLGQSCPGSHCTINI